jgi:hypothetical protein
MNTQSVNSIAIAHNVRHYVWLSFEGVLVALSIYRLVVT